MINEKTFDLLDISIVIPVFNEQGNILRLWEELHEVMESLSQSYEIIFVNDGSADNSLKILKKIHDSHVQVVNLMRNYGQTAALRAGIDMSKGSVVVMLDGDGQNPPSSILKLISKFNEGYDLVSGWREFRNDHILTRKLPSFIANKIIAKISGVPLHDFGCTLKAYNGEMLRSLRLYGEMHRFIPVYIFWAGGSIVEISVEHKERSSGVSKYGLNRSIKVILDLIVVVFLHRFFTRPMYVFGGFGFFCLFLGVAFGIVAVYLKLYKHWSFIQTPLPLLSLTSLMLGGISILMGLLAEIIIRNYFESQNKSIYKVKST